MHPEYEVVATDASSATPRCMRSVGMWAMPSFRRSWGASPAPISCQDPQLPARSLHAGRRSLRRARPPRCHLRPRCPGSRPRVTSGIRLSTLHDPHFRTGHRAGRRLRSLGARNGGRSLEDDLSANHTAGDLVAGCLARGHRRKIAAISHHRDAVRDGEHLPQFVRDEDDRMPGRANSRKVARGWSASCGVSTAVGSSKINTFASHQAFSLSTIVGRPPAVPNRAGRGEMRR